jgi:hypothetical protein
VPSLLWCVTQCARRAEYECLNDPYHLPFAGASPFDVCLRPHKVDMWHFAGIPIVPENHAWFTAVLVFTCLAVAFVLMRFASRAFLSRKLGTDDYLMFLAMVSLYVEKSLAMSLSFDESCGMNRSCTDGSG